MIKRTLTCLKNYARKQPEIKIDNPGGIYSAVETMEFHR